MNRTSLRLTLCKDISCLREFHWGILPCCFEQSRAVYIDIDFLRWIRFCGRKIVPVLVCKLPRDAGKINQFTFDIQLTHFAFWTVNGLRCFRLEDIGKSWNARSILYIYFQLAFFFIALKIEITPPVFPAWNGTEITQSNYLQKSSDLQARRLQQ